MQQLADADALRLQENLYLAIKQHPKKIIILTHVPLECRFLFIGDPHVVQRGLQRMPLVNPPRGAWAQPLRVIGQEICWNVMTIPEILKPGDSELETFMEQIGLQISPILSTK